MFFQENIEIVAQRFLVNPLEPATLIEKRLRYSCFSFNFVKVFRIDFLREPRVTAYEYMKLFSASTTFPPSAI